MERGTDPNFLCLCEASLAGFQPVSSLFRQFFCLWLGTFAYYVKISSDYQQVLKDTTYHTVEDEK